MWGQEVFDAENADQYRIIPTRVGTRADKIHNQTVHEDHPHACGDKLYYLLWISVSKGSSPRVWGQVGVQLNAFRVFGIIPTRVGTSLSVNLRRKVSRDHPHACGDKASERIVQG